MSCGQMNFCFSNDNPLLYRQLFSEYFEFRSKKNQNLNEEFFNYLILYTKIDIDEFKRYGD
jgi:hypothetical protein